jgi:hypothetical protein
MIRLNIGICIAFQFLGSILLGKLKFPVYLLPHQCYEVLLSDANRERAVHVFRPHWLGSVIVRSTRKSISKWQYTTAGEIYNSPICWQANNRLSYIDYKQPTELRSSVGWTFFNRSNPNLTGFIISVSSWHGLLLLLLLCCCCHSTYAETSHSVFYFHFLS